jgi:hypothetical protein
MFIYEVVSFPASRMEPEDAEVVIPVRPKTTHVRMGRSNGLSQDGSRNETDDVSNIRDEMVARPRTSLVRMPRSDPDVPEGLRPSWSSEPVTVKPKLSNLKSSR